MNQDSKSKRLQRESTFHDNWAQNEDITTIDVRQVNEACTSPELRYIHKVIGDIRGKKILDVGCGLGEVSAYFAKNGGNVVATDLSSEMLSFASALAKRERVTIETHLSNAEDFRLPANTFDIIYVGNLFHHVDIENTIIRLKPLLKAGGMLVSWDPLAYNPLINGYRVLAKNVRTPDEHPFTLSDLQLFKSHFQKVEFKFFWLTSLLVFILMFVVQRRSPNNERYWKKVVQEADSWAPIYKPLEFLDLVILKLFPFLRPLCWNVVVVARN